MRRTLPQEFNFLNSLKINFRAIDKIMKLPFQQIKGARTFRLNEKEREFSKLEKVSNLKKRESVSLEEEEKKIVRKKRKNSKVRYD